MKWNNFIERAKNTLRRRGSLRHDHITITKQKQEEESLSGRPLATPAVDIFENPKEMLILADVPGATASDTVVTWNEKDQLILSVQTSAEDISGQPLVLECMPRHYHWSFKIPDYLNVQKAEAKLKDGVLQIRIPRDLDVIQQLILIKGTHY